MSAVTSPEFFTGARRTVFLAIAGRIVPDEGTASPGANSDATIASAEKFLADQDEATRAKLRLLLRVIEWRAGLKFGRRFSRLPAEKQDTYLRAWQNSRLQIFRFGFSSLRNLVLLSFYTRPESWGTIGYPGPVLEAKAANP